VVDPLTRTRSDGPDEIRALLVLDGLPGVGPATLGRVVERFGSAAAALRGFGRSLAAAMGDEAAAALRDPERPRVVDRALERAERLGIAVVGWGSEAYPAELFHLADPPPVLFLRGRMTLLERSAVTVVGSRRATARSRDLAERLGAGLVRAGVVVTSGLALGVDGAAHRGALAAEGDTIAVLGTGPDFAYPPSHARLFRDVAERGLLVSEFLPGTPALPHNFPRRNRILAALAGAIVVVEAGERSGALITVDHALDLGRDVWAVPGPIEQPACVGSNRLLADGARPLLSIADFVRAIAPDAEPAQGSLALDIGPDARLLGALADGPLDVDELARRLGVGVAEALALATQAELRGAVRRLPGMRFRGAA
jgi:DNA processing protein